MVSDQKQAHMRWLAVPVSLMLLLSLLMSALPQSNAFAVTCKYKHTVVAGDTVMYLGDLYQINWLKIADANNLQPPYALAVGQVLCIPEGSSAANSNTNSNNNGNTNTTKNKGGTPKLDVVNQLGHVLVSVENFTPKTPYYVRLYMRPSNISYRVGNFTTNKEGDWSGWFKIPPFMPRYAQTSVCVKNTWTDAVSCVSYNDDLAGIPVNLLVTRCRKEGR
jgi:hypothetical protein